MGQDVEAVAKLLHAY